MSFFQDEVSKDYFMLIDSKKQVTRINIDNIDILSENAKDQRLRLVYHIAEEDEGGLFGKGKGTQIVKKEDLFETPENDRIIKTFTAIRNKLLTPDFSQHQKS
jgi:hypothetical protein